MNDSDTKTTGTPSITDRLNAAQLREVEESVAKEAVKNVKRQPLYLILDTVYDTYNIGGLFRLADGLAVEKMYLCGKMETPPNNRIYKASIGTYKVVRWEYKHTTVEAIMALRALHKDIQVIAVEQSAKSAPYTEIEYTRPMAIVVGNETYGVSEETMAACDQIVEIPMWGINKSLNVIISAAIVAYHAVGVWK